MGVEEAKRKRTVKVIARASVPFQNLHYYDQQYFGLIAGGSVFETCTDQPKEEALTQFHLSIPIKVLDDFDIEAVFIPSGKNENCLRDVVCPVALMHAVITALESRDEEVKFYEMYEVRESFKLKRRSVDIGEMRAFLPHTAQSASEMFSPLNED